MSNLANNKLIAEFWGMKLGVDGTVYYDDAENLHPPTPINQLKFHTSWKWLMPVVEEMNTYGCEVVISSNGVTTIYAPSGEVLAEESSEEDDHMRDATYKAIVKVLKENLHKPC